MLEAIERIRRLTDKPLAAQPNAGIPRSIEGRNIYLCSPEYMASYARKFVNAGVSLVGGCCGTTPEHIKAMNSALRMADAKGKNGGFRVITETKRESSITPPPLAQRSNLGKKLAAGEFVTLVEIAQGRRFPQGSGRRKVFEGRRH
jgi:homocysteine S-methyltransferase